MRSSRLAADERRVVAARDALVATDRDEPVGRHPLRLALQLQRLDRLDLDRVADEPIGQVAEQDLAGRRGLLEARRHVDRVAGGQALARGGVAGHHLTGVDAGAVGEGHAPASARAPG